jgi:hypothetical protein
MLVMLCWRRGGAGHTDTEGIALQRGTCVAEYPWPLQLALSISEYDLVCLDKLSLPPIVALASNTAPLMVIKVAACAWLASFWTSLQEMQPNYRRGTANSH